VKLGSAFVQMRNTMLHHLAYVHNSNY